MISIKAQVEAMVKKKAKKQSKRKKAQKEPNIRTDVWQLVMTQKQRRQVDLDVQQLSSNVQGSTN